jgi:hypothetical protein
MQRFTVYVYEHLMEDAEAMSDDLAELRGCMQTWGTWDTVEAISRHRTVSDRLRAFPVWNKEERLQRVIALDIDSLCARLYVILHDREQYHRLIELPEEQSQMVLNLLQTVRPSLFSLLLLN